MTEKILAKELENDLMLYNAENDNVHVLNPTARLIYELFKKGKDVHEIEKEIRITFNVDETQDLHDDILKYLDEMRKKGLIT
jgi:hypothetical protein